MRALEDKVTAEQDALLGKKPEPRRPEPASAQDRHRRFRQGGSARGPGAVRRAGQGLRQADAHEGRYRRGRSRAPSWPASPKPMRRKQLIEPQSRDRGQSAAAQAERHRIERHDRGRVGGRRQAGAGRLPRRHSGRSAPEVRLVDSHCHLDDAKFDARPRGRSSSARCAAGVESHDGDRHRRRSARSGSRPSGWPSAIRSSTPPSASIRTTRRRPRPRPSRGLRELAAHPKVLAIGEIGLDYHYDFSPREVQRAVFERQLELAAECREAHRDPHPRSVGRHAGDAARNTGAAAASCTASPATRRRRAQALDLGFHLSFGGVLTFPKAEAVRQAARITPDDRLLVETDCPYLAPVPHRGKRNEPAFVVETVRRLAEVRGVHAGGRSRKLPRAISNGCVCEGGSGNR